MINGFNWRTIRLMVAAYRVARHKKNITFISIDSFCFSVIHSFIHFFCHVFGGKIIVRLIWMWAVVRVFILPSLLLASLKLPKWNHLFGCESFETVRYRLGVLKWFRKNWKIYSVKVIISMHTFTDQRRDCLSNQSSSFVGTISFIFQCNWNFPLYVCVVCVLAWIKR